MKANNPAVLGSFWNLALRSIRVARAYFSLNNDVLE